MVEGVPLSQVLLLDPAPVARYRAVVLLGPCVETWSAVSVVLVCLMTFVLVHSGTIQIDRHMITFVVVEA